MPLVHSRTQLLPFCWLARFCCCFFRSRVVIICATELPQRRTFYTYTSHCLFFFVSCHFFFLLLCLFVLCYVTRLTGLTKANFWTPRFQWCLCRRRRQIPYPSAFKPVQRASVLLFWGDVCLYLSYLLFYITSFMIVFVFWRERWLLVACTVREWLFLYVLRLLPSFSYCFSSFKMEIKKQTSRVCHTTTAWSVYFATTFLFALLNTEVICVMLLPCTISTD